MHINRDSYRLSIQYGVVAQTVKTYVFSGIRNTSALEPRKNGMVRLPNGLVIPVDDCSNRCARWPGDVTLEVGHERNYDVDSKCSFFTAIAKRNINIILVELRKGLRYDDRLPVRPQNPKGQKIGYLVMNHAFSRSNADEKLIFHINIMFGLHNSLNICIVDAVFEHMSINEAAGPGGHTSQYLHGNFGQFE